MRQNLTTDVGKGSFSSATEKYFKLQRKMRKIILVCNYKMLVETDFAVKSSSILSYTQGD